MGIKLINKLASAGLVLSFCGLAVISSFAQEKDAEQAVLKSKPAVKTEYFSKETARDFSPVSSKRQSSSSSDSWTGFYVGGYAGSAMGRSSANTSTVFTPTGYFASSSVTAVNSAGGQRIKPSGFTGGGTAGYNYQTGNFLFGVEADFGSQNLNKFVSTTTTYPCCAPNTFTITQGVKTKWVLTARPRAGYVFGKALIYATGGLAMTDITYTSIFTDNFASAFEANLVKEARAGWTGGGGIEFKLAKRWSAKGEYLFSDYGRMTNTATGLTAFTPSQSFPGNVFTHSTDLRTHSVRFGVNYHF